MDGVGTDEQERDRSTVERVHEGVEAGMNRRSFIGVLLAAGVGAGLATLLSPGDVLRADRGEMPIVYAVARSDPDDPESLAPRKKTVPANWYDEVNRALEIHRGLAPTELAGFVGSYVVPGGHEEPGASISVQSTAEGIRDELADVAAGDLFSVEVVEELPDAVGEGPGGPPRVRASIDEQDVPGGVLCEAGDSQGSLAPALYDPETGRRHFATSNHLYGGDGTDHSGEPLDLVGRDGRAIVGSVRRGFAAEDVVVAEPVGGRVPASAISGESPGTVIGQFTDLGLADLQARGEELAKVGAFSGHTAGEIKGIDGVTFYTDDTVRTGQLLWGSEETFTDGDSGSVNYHPDPGNDNGLLVGGFNNARTWWPGADFTWGTAAYHLRDERGLTF